MRRLYTKIFLWFLVAITLVGGTLIFFGVEAQSEYARASIESNDRTLTPPFAERWATVFERQGKPGLTEYRAHASGVGIHLAVRQLAEGNLNSRVGSVITNRKDELADLGRDFNRMAERIESLMGSQQQRIANPCTVPGCRTRSGCWSARLRTRRRRKACLS
jgi:hypothetical protein